MPAPGEYRPAPADFAENAWLSQAVLTKMYRAGASTVSRWRLELGDDDPRLADRRPPEGFAQMAEISSKAALSRHYGVGRDKIASWLKALVTPPERIRTKPRRPIPEDFRELGPTMTNAALQRHYVADYDTIKRWSAECDVTLAAHDYAAAARAQPRPSGFHFRGHAQIQRHMDLRQITMFDAAADVLRRERFVVYRCDQRGRYSEKGDFWRLGNTLLTPDELLQRADKYRERAA